LALVAALATGLALFGPQRAKGGQPLSKRLSQLRIRTGCVEMVEQGLVGIVLTAGAIASLAIGLARKNASLRRGSLDRSLGLCCEAGLLAVLLSTVVIHMQEAPMPWMWLGLAWAWLRLPSDGGDAA
jgi:hypothetical protein